MADCMQQLGRDYNIQLKFHEGWEALLRERKNNIVKPQQPLPRNNPHLSLLNFVRIQLASQAAAEATLSSHPSPLPAPATCTRSSIEASSEPKTKDA
jgi:hypothetical protein